MDRRGFLSRLALGTTGLLVGDAALEAFERLTHRKVFALGAPVNTVYTVDPPKLNDALTRLYIKTNEAVRVAMKASTEEYEWVDVPDNAMMERVGDVEVVRSRFVPPGQFVLMNRGLLRRKGLVG